MPKDRSKHADFLNVCLISNDKNYHYIAVTKLHCFLNNGKYLNGEKTCPYCLLTIRGDEKFKNHISGDCFTISSVKTILPSSKQTSIKFKNLQYQHRAPFFITSDFECDIESSCENTHSCQEHHYPNSYLYKVVCPLDPSLSETIVIRRSKPEEGKNREEIASELSNQYYEDIIATTNRLK